MYNYDNNRIIAIGDIHGDYDIFIELLKLAKVINTNLEWIGNDTYVIQMGDTLDGKRPDLQYEKKYLEKSGEIEITKLILNLDKQAKMKKGRVISILGNHELYPYYYYNDETFNDNYVKNSDLKNYIRLYKINRFQYYRPGKGKGAKLFAKTRPLIIQLGKFIFCHGSLNENFLKLCLENNLKKNSNSEIVDINKVNKLMEDWLSGKNKKVPFFINDYNDINPLFNRQLSHPKSLDKNKCVTLVDNVLKYFNNANYLVMGHSTHKNINVLCGKVFRTDIAISRAFGSLLDKNKLRIQVLEIIQKNNKIKTSILTTRGKIIIS